MIQTFFIYVETETTLKAIKQKLSDVQSSSSQSSKYHYEFQSIKQKLIQWIEAASIITKNLSGVEPTPNRLKAYLMNIEKWTEEYRQELRLLVRYQFLIKMIPAFSSCPKEKVMNFLGLV